MVYLIATPEVQPERPYYLGEIKIFAGDFAPPEWALCDGRLLPISTNMELFSLLGTNYGGDGLRSFAIPDLRGRTLMHQGWVRGVGDKGSVGFTDAGVDYSDWSDCRTATGSLALNYIISLTGILPFPQSSEKDSNVSSLLAEGRIFAFNFEPQGWAGCNGQLLPLGVSHPGQNTSLFCLIAQNYGGEDYDEISNPKPPFALPDLRGLIPLHDPSALGNRVGQEDGISDESFVGLKGVMNFLALNCCIALDGDFPLRPDEDGNVRGVGSSKVAAPLIGEIRIFFGNFAPWRWAFCEGQLLSIQEHQELFFVDWYDVWR